METRGIYDDAAAQVYINADYQAHRGSVRAQAYFGNVDQLTEYLCQHNWTIGQFENRLHVLDLASLSACVYDAGCVGNIIFTGGTQHTQYTRVPPERFGLTNADLEMGNGFRAAVFQDGNRYVLAFAGTDNASLGFFPDMLNNTQQTFGLQSAQYDAAIRLANRISGSVGIGSLELTGHSLGAGLASVGAAVTGRNATIFSSAPLSSATLQRYNMSNYVFDNDTHYYVRGDPVPASANMPGQNGPTNQIAVGSVFRYLGEGSPAGLYFNHSLATIIPLLTPQYREFIPPINIDISGM